MQFVNPEFLRQLLPLLVIAIGLYFLLTPSIGAADQKQRLMPFAFGCTAGIGIGFMTVFSGRARALSMHWRM